MVGFLCSSKAWEYSCPSYESGFRFLVFLTLELLRLGLGSVYYVSLQEKTKHVYGSGFMISRML